ncbi:TetR/AcrR family transcriptional regulator [Thermomonospora umbrina]|uniref:TetR family transcriptional regulator n=1 Tax=Thermomonospora umbrina TaxID=111806 RepID=A0A3D9SMS2_9ACTN|nr:TetR/AcrR family transcriptional regulator [Thermomonospora umbrina]REE97148.1 TetR family transcriptional regulator [Thermomonospora umbrina]
MVSTRERILDAAAEVMHARGLAHTTTKEIAKAAGCSEAALYKHFRDKSEIFVRVLRERLPHFSPVPYAAGTGTVRGNLREIARTALEFYRASFPIAVSIFSEPLLLEAHRASLRRHGSGPEGPILSVADYLRAERDLGRIAAGTDPDATAALLVGACFQHAFLEHFHGNAGGADLDTLADSLTTALLTQPLPTAEENDPTPSRGR